MRISDWSSDVCSSDLGMNRKAFVNHKERVNAQKKFIDVKLSDISLYRYPGSDDQLMLAEFTQHYRSDNYKLDSRKQQFWKRDGNGEWKIFREESRCRYASGTLCIGSIVIARAAQQPSCAAG